MLFHILNLFHFMISIMVFHILFHMPLHQNSIYHFLYDINFLSKFQDSYIMVFLHSFHYLIKRFLLQNQNLLSLQNHLITIYFKVSNLCVWYLKYYHFITLFLHYSNTINYLYYYTQSLLKIESTLIFYVSW